LMLARAAWIAVVTLTMSLIVASILAKIALLHVPCPTARCTTGQLHPASLRTLEDLGLSLDTFAVYTVAIDVIFAVVWCAAAVLIFWRRSYDLMACGASGRLMDFFSGIRPPAPLEVFPELSEREREILDLKAQGRKYPEIAAELYLSPKTVRNYVSNILHKLQIADRAEAPAKPGSARMGLSDERD